ncbi:hypothetical protein [Rhizobium oryzicola]|uniref:DUF2059 domain-containing protein n=1 Tax=Rhizobium oryzicola TaxID=1232668 RepID=A0ABT8SX93_9HYPH|nr:hypothetical protein [Rhizobium oryzicola]MDO1583080.1 hypothetical protein [Rhizobium oryzicola]
MDQSLLQIEQIHSRLQAVPTLVEGAAQAAQADGVRGVSDLKPLLEKAVAASFKADAIEERLSEDLGTGGTIAADSTAFAKAAQAFAKASKAYGGQTAAISGEGLTPEVKSHLTDGESGARIARLVEAMASPDLAGETAFTGQVMYVALETFTNSSAAELRDMSLDTLNQQMAGVLKTLRARTSNEKPLPKDVARAQEKNRLALMLANLAPDDLKALSDFYESDAGKAKREALVAGYRQASEDANFKMLDAFFRQLSGQLKTNPKLHQN